MGWEYVKFRDRYVFDLENLQFATAEGVVTLAAIIDSLRRGANAKVDVLIESNAKSWSRALHLEQLVQDRWLDSFPLTPSKAGGCLTHPLWRYELATRAACQKTARRISAQVRHLLDKLNIPNSAEVATSVRIVFQEALLNIFEHAYDEADRRLAFEAITITPVPRRSDLKKLAYATKEEQRWFEANAGLMLEVAVADYGKSVPASLWEAYFREHSADRDRARKLQSGTRQGRHTRSTLHHNIALWSFNHKSTRKAHEDFVNDFARVNWRGLHRALNTAAKFDGCLIMRSGQARTGYSFVDGTGIALGVPEAAQREFPGTCIVFRIPLHISRESHRRVQAEFREPSESTIKLHRLVQASDLKSIADTHTDPRNWLGIVHPFKSFDEHSIIKLREDATTLAPNMVGIHLFTSFDSEVVTEHLRAFDSSASVTEFGIPRMAGFWSPGQRVLWRFIGLVPEYARPVVTSLEEHGVVNLPKAGKERAFAELLRHAYTSGLEITDDSLRLRLFSSRLWDEDIDAALQMAFDVWSGEPEKPWLFDQPNTYVRLTTGRLIKRYVSLFKMLYSDEGLAQATGWRLAKMIKEAQREHPSLCLVTESESSYFIARMLLQEQDVKVDVYSGKPAGRLALDRPTIIFADAIYRGETLGILLSTLRHCERVICCLDLRSPSRLPFDEPALPISPLLTLTFDPQEVASTSVSGNSKILEVDRVTHIPVEGPETERLELGTNSERTEFVENNSALFRYGLQRTGGRLHVVAMASDAIDAHRATFGRWITEIARTEINRITNRKAVDVVFFSRVEATVRDIIPELSVSLSETSGIRSVYGAVLPFVPSGPREIFSRPSPELFYGLQRLTTNNSQSEVPSHYLAVYLDDACVTGRTLLNFLISLGKASRRQLPIGIIAIPVLSRFSPAEEQFYSSVFRAVGTSDSKRSQIPFLFGPLFRLQIRSFEKLQASFAFELATRLSAQASFLDPRLQRYIAKTLERLEEALPVGQRGSESQVLQHPFFGGETCTEYPVSARAVRIRHLIALQEQNVGVLGDLLHELLAAAKSRDFSLLTVIALELNLLGIPPLQKECRADLIELAVNALKSDQVPLEIKSDAVSVLSMIGQTLIERLAELLPVIGSNSDLVDQFLVFLLTRALRAKVWMEDLMNSVRACASQLPPDEYRYISGYVKSFFEVTEPLSVRSTSDAIHAIENLVSQTSYHGKGLTALNAINDWLSKKERDRVRTSGREVRGKLHDAIDVVRKTILLGLDGLVWWAEFENPNHGAEMAFRNARFQLIHCMNSLESIGDGLGAEPVGSDVAIQIENLWHTLRQYSHRIGPEYFLSQSVTSSELEPTVLERWMPEFFCLPIQILNRLSPAHLPRVRITSVWERAEKGFSIVMTSVPLDPVLQVFELLLSDMKSHGSNVDNSITLALDVSDGSKNLIVTLEDRVRSDDAKGTGKSQAKVRSLLEPLNVTIEFDRKRRAGEIYQVKMVFSDVIAVKCY